MAILIKANRVVEKVLPKNKKTFTLAELQEYVGGYIEIVPIEKVPHFYMRDALMVVNEEGKLNGLPINIIATDIYLYNHTGIMGVDTIVGDVLICKSKEIA